MRSPNHYYYTGGASLFKVFRLGIRLAIFGVAPLVVLSLGRTEGLFPRLKTPTKIGSENSEPILLWHKLFSLDLVGFVYKLNAAVRAVCNSCEGLIIL